MKLKKMQEGIENAKRQEAADKKRKEDAEKRRRARIRERPSVKRRSRDAWLWMKAWVHCLIKVQKF